MSTPRRTASRRAGSTVHSRDEVRLTPNGLTLRGSAGPRILGHLGLDDAALAAYLAADAPRWVRGVLWCQFEGPASLDAIAAHFSAAYTLSRSVDPHVLPDETEVLVPSVHLRVPGRYVAYSFYGKRGDTYVEDGSWQFVATFRESGTDWGSNRAVYERFRVRL